MFGIKLIFCAALVFDHATPYFFIQREGHYSAPSETVTLPAARGYIRPPHISQEVWDNVSLYFLPESHPIKPILDQIFFQSRATASLKSMKKAGFDANKPMKWTHLVVARHPDTPEYIFKVFLDAQRLFKKFPVEDLWMLRIEGVNLIRNELDKMDWNHIFKVPRKWIYPLPANPAASKDFVRKDFILVEDDMDILSKTDNEAVWQSDVITTDILDAIYHLVTEYGLYDSPKPNNMPFSNDGRIAFVDTQVHHVWPVKYYKLTPHLNAEMKAYWKEITR